MIHAQLYMSKNYPILMLSLCNWIKLIIYNLHHIQIPHNYYTLVPKCNKLYFEPKGILRLKIIHSVSR